MRLCPSKTALIVVDVQNDFCHEDGAFSRHNGIDTADVRKAVSALLSLIRDVRNASLPVVFVRTLHSEWTDSPSWERRLEGDARQMGICVADSWGSEFYRVTPEQRDCIVIKHRYSAFFETDLDLILRSRGIAHLLIAGVATNVCVESTVRDACNRNYRVVLIEDCCGAFDRREHEAAVRNIERYFGEVAHSTTVSQILKDHRSKGARDETS